MSEPINECGPRSLTKTVQKTQEKVDEGMQTVLDLRLRLEEAVKLNGHFKLNGIAPRNGAAKGGEKPGQ
jgi:hypothetical protein